jgi:hypothetical protein
VRLFWRSCWRARVGWLGLATSPTARTLAECRKRGWLACVVEKWISQTRRRVDAFGFGDLLVLDGQPGSLLIQATSASHVSDRRAKILLERTEPARRWLDASNRIEVWGWLAPTKTIRRWRLRTVPIVLADFAEQPDEKQGSELAGG